jgi:hypothetical protein
MVDHSVSLHQQTQGVLAKQKDGAIGHCAEFTRYA